MGRGTPDTKNPISVWLEISRPARRTELAGGDGVRAAGGTPVSTLLSQKTATQFWIIAVTEEYGYAVISSYGFPRKTRRLELYVEFHDFLKLASNSDLKNKFWGHLAGSFG